MAKTDKQPERRIGKGPPPPKHKPTKHVPAGFFEAASEDAQRVCVDEALRVASVLEADLGTPFYSRDGFILYNADCMDVLAAIERSRVAIASTVTSPPYNIGKEYERPLSLEEYLDWCERWIDLIWRTTSSRGTFWLNLGYLEVPGKGKAVPIPYLLWNRTRFYLQQEVVWHYEAGVASKLRFSPRNEKWLFYTKDPKAYTFNLDAVRDPNVKYPNQKKNGKFRCNPLGKNPGDVWPFPKVTTGKKRSSKERTSHPAQFPLSVVDRVVKVASNPGEIVLDPFAGSGSAGVAAVANGRPFIGCELRLDYCEETAARFDRFLEERRASTNQQDLFK